MKTVKGSKLILNIPPCLAGYEGEFERAFSATIYKMAKNAHKGKWEGVDLATCMNLLRAEVEELADAIAYGNSMDIVLETADIQNFAIIACSIALANRGGNNEES